MVERLRVIATRTPRALHLAERFDNGTALRLSQYFGMSADFWMIPKRRKLANPQSAA
jgi:plasmid maintenance system antidote protein VapI